MCVKKTVRSICFGTKVDAGMEFALIECSAASQEKRPLYRGNLLIPLEGTTCERVQTNLLEARLFWLCICFGTHLV